MQNTIVFNRGMSMAKMIGSSARTSKGVHIYEGSLFEPRYRSK